MWCVRRTRRLDGHGHETRCRLRASLGRAIVVAAAAVRRRRGRGSSQDWRAQRGRFGNKDGRSDAIERNTPSTTNEFNESELTDGGSEFPRG